MSFGKGDDEIIVYRTTAMLWKIVTKNLNMRSNGVDYDMFIPVYIAVKSGPVFNEIIG